MTITPAKRGKGARQQATAEPDDRSPMERHIAMTWARRLKRVFGIDINECEKCKGPVRIAAPAHPCARGINAFLHVIACIEDPVVIEKILTHLKAKEANDVSPITRLPPPRAPPLLPMWEQGLAD